MVFTNNYTKRFLNQFPDFKNSDSLKEAMEMFEEKGKVSITGFFFGLTSYFINELSSQDTSTSYEKKQILYEIENILNKFHNFPEGTEECEFKNAVCVSFLEDLQNHASQDNSGYQYSQFVPFLGPRSKLFCQSWDAFTNVRSPGLWTNEEWQSRFSIRYLDPNTIKYLKSRDIEYNLRTDGLWTDEEWENRHLSNK